MSLLLAIHTSTPVLALGTYSLTESVREHKADYWRLDRQMGGELHRYLGEVVCPEEWSQLKAIAVIVGPGSFTSCRMGVTVARTLGQTLQVPVFGVSALAAIAYRYLHSRSPDCHQQSEKVGVYLDAKRGEYCAGIYQMSNGLVRAEQPEQLFQPLEWETITAKRGIAVIDADQGETVPPPLTAMAAIAAQQYFRGERPHWSEVLPYYSRKPPIHGGVS